MRRVLLPLLALLAGGVPAAHAAEQTPLQRGEYLTRAADCAACHSAPGRQAWTGGREVDLPFGVLFSANITPDRDVGIGRYTDDEWVEMLHHGIGRGGRHL